MKILKWSYRPEVILGSAPIYDGFRLVSVIRMSLLNVGAGTKQTFSSGASRWRLAIFRNIDLNTIILRR